MTEFSTDEISCNNVSIAGAYCKQVTCDIIKENKDMWVRLEIADECT